MYICVLHNAVMHLTREMDSTTERTSFSTLLQRLACPWSASDRKASLGILTLSFFPSYFFSLYVTWQHNEGLMHPTIGIVTDFLASE